MSRARCLLVSSSPLPRSRNLNRGDRVFCKILQDGSTRLAAERHLFTSWRIVLTRRQSPRSYRARCFYRVRATTTNLRWLVRQTLHPLPPPPLLQKPFPVPKHRNGRFHRPRYIGYERSSLVQSRFNSASNLLGTIESARILISREFV